MTILSNTSKYNELHNYYNIKYTVNNRHYLILVYRNTPQIKFDPITQCD